MGETQAKLLKQLCLLNTLLFFFSSPPPFNQSSHDVAKWRGCLALSKAELGTKLGRQAVWVTMRWVILELRAVRTENPSNYQCKARAHWLS